MLDLTLPEQKQASLSFCEATPRALTNWADGLPKANIGEMSKRLYHAIVELNQLIALPLLRLQLLEVLRPQIHFVCTELGRHFIGQPIALPEKQRKVANLAQALQLHLSGGYKTALVELLLQGGVDKHKKITAMAAQRVITDLSCTILRANQLYCASPTNAWLECHRIFRFAFENKLNNLKVEDETNLSRKETSVDDSYKRLLLLGSCRPNQLRQNELAQVFELFQSWADLVDCSPRHVTDALFVVNLERDAPPVYRSLLHDALASYYYGLDTSDLAHRLSEYLSLQNEHKKRDPHLLEVPPSISDNLLAHLSQALGILTKRSFKRMSSAGRIEVAVGLSAAHYHCAGKVEFQTFIAGSGDMSLAEDNLFLSAAARRRDDKWAGGGLDVSPGGEAIFSADVPIAFKSAKGTSDPDVEKPLLKAQKVTLINTSPGGYCAAWEGDTPAALQAGEVMAVREQADHPWSLAVIRWIRQVKHQGTQIGIELLAPVARPCGVRLLQKTGGSSEYLRGLLLPELSSIGQPATLITPRLPFQTGHRITLFHDGHEDQCQLSRRVSATGCVSQFEVKFLTNNASNGDSNNGQQGSNSAGSNAGKSASEDEFDSLWPSL